MKSRLERRRLKGHQMNFKEDDRQDLIDYLVYLESFAPLVVNKMVRLEIVDDLFGYRFFLAVNNEAVQKFELCPERKYYRGCCMLHRVWKKYREENGLPIPLQDTDLSKWEHYGKYT